MPKHSRGQTPATLALDDIKETVEGCVLRVLSGADANAAFDLVEGSAVVGTSSRADLRLTDPAVSGQHLRVTPAPGGLKVEDLGSTNGTFYLGTRVHEAVVPHGAVLRLGRVQLHVGSRQPPASQTYSDRTSYGSLLGGTPIMRRLYALLEKLEETDFTVLVTGETGTGKELVAAEIHRHSARSNKPYVVLDCGAVSPTLVESELFGHLPGAFTGASKRHQGVFERAHTGTLFVDEIGELPLELQPRLLRALENRSVRPLGGREPIEIDTRLVAATHRNLEQDVREGRFREDLFFRLNVVRIALPPLRRRREDIPPLIGVFLQQMDKGDFSLSDDTLELFVSGYDWPGNARELRHALASVVSLGTVPDAIQPGSRGAARVELDIDEPLLEAKKRLIDAVERDYLVAQLERAGNNISEAARLSGVDRGYFKRMLKRHGI